MILIKASLKKSWVTMCTCSQKQRPEVFCKKMFLKILKTSQENSWVPPRPATVLKKRLCHRCFPTNFVKFLRTSLVSKMSVAVTGFTSTVDLNRLYQLLFKISVKYFLLMKSRNLYKVCAPTLVTWLRSKRHWT